MKQRILLTLLLFIFFASCSQEPIFYDISREIKLEEPNVLGNVNSIVKLKDHLYTQNGNIYKKGLKEQRAWNEISNPGRTVALASDANHLYALVAGQVDDDGEVHSYQLYVLIDGLGSWKTVAGASSSSIVLFDNGVVGDSTTTSGRRAYIRIAEEVKQLSGDTLGATTTANGAGKETVAAAALGGTDYFSNTRSFCSDGINTLYSIRDDKVSTSPSNLDDSWTDSDVSISDATIMVYALDKLYVGTSIGIEQVQLKAEGDVPDTKSNLPSNAEATTGELIITTLAFFQSVDDNTIYAGAIEQLGTKYNALWAYYPSRGNWNFE